MGQGAEWGRGVEQAEGGCAGMGGSGSLEARMPTSQIRDMGHPMRSAVECLHEQNRGSVILNHFLKDLLICSIPTVSPFGVN